MANTAHPSGLTPVGHLNGSPYNGQANLYVIAASDTNAFAVGDPVKLNPAGSTSDGLPGITLADATGGILGAIVGLGKTPALASPDSEPRTRPSGAQAEVWYALVCDSPDVVFEVEEVATGTALTAASIGKNVNLVAGANNGFVSGWTASNVTPSTDDTDQVKILRLVQRPDNTIGKSARWLCKIMAHEFDADTP